MEKFAIDLDKVLDDFELEEDQKAQTRPTRISSPLKEIMQTPQLAAPVDLNLHREALPTKNLHREQFVARAEQDLSDIQPETQPLTTPEHSYEQNSASEPSIQALEQVLTSSEAESSDTSEVAVTETPIPESPVNEAREVNVDAPAEVEGDLVSFGEDLPPPQQRPVLMEDAKSATHQDLLDLDPWDSPGVAPPSDSIHSPPLEAAMLEERQEERVTALNPPLSEEEPIPLPKNAITFDALPEVTDDELNSYLESLNEMEEPEATPPSLPVTPETAPVDPPSLPEPVVTEINDFAREQVPNSGEETQAPMTALQTGEESDERCLASPTSSDTDSTESLHGEIETVQAEASIRELPPSTLQVEATESAAAGAVGLDSAPECSESSVSSQETSPDPGSEGSLRSEPEINGLTASLEPYSSLSEEERMLGILKPFWIPDEDALVCMQCNTKFNVIKRRHHCRACGKVLCSLCCNMKAPLEYLDKKEGRVCQPCLLVLNKVEAYKKYASSQLEPNLPSPTNSGGGSSPMAAEPQHPMGLAATRQTVNPNNPAEYCSTISPWQQMAGAVSRPPPAVYVPVGVLKKEGSSRGREPKTVVFSDGIRPGRDLTDMEGWGSPQMSPVRQTRLTESTSGPSTDSSQLLCVEADLPPVLIPSLQALSLSSHSPLSAEALTTILRDSDVPAVIFVVLKNLHVSVKLVHLDCCVKKWCWCFASEGLRLVGQDEILLVIEQEDGELLPPKDIFQFYKTLSEEAAQGQVVTELGHYLIPGPFLGTSDLGGFVFVRSSFQCLQKLPIPQPPSLVGLLIQRWETPWAKVFPLRLVLRLGAEFRYYPCPLISVRRRSPVFAEVGHTIINLLADMRNFTYCLPTIPGLRVHMENKQTSVLIPRNRYDKVCRALGQSNDHVLSFGASFSPEADSHLVCMQQEDGSYQTQAINIHNKARSVIGASFIVFNGALKSASGLTATSTVVEDGIMLQLLPDTLVALRQALLNMKEFTIPCGRVAEEVDETVHIHWGPDDKNINADVTSPIDGRSLAGIMSVRVPHSKEHKGEGKLALKWTEAFLIQTEDSAESPRRPRRPGTSGVETVDAVRLAENLARASCQALIPHVRSLGAFRVVAVRVTLDADTVEYEAGTGGHRLPPACMGHLDSALIPFLHKEAASAANSAAGGFDSRIVIEIWLRIYHQ